MKIIQNGNPKLVFSATKRFRCGACGCVFAAEKDEYTAGSQYNETFYQCKCPECMSTANEVVMRRSNYD